MKKITYIIGANNLTKLVETDKIESVLNKVYSGYTLSNTVDYRKGNKESSVKIEVLEQEKENIQEEVELIIKELKKVLKQDCIIVEINDTNALFL